MDISIIVTCYSEGELLRRAIRSLQDQTDRGFEVVLVNDGSPDPETNRVCEEIREQYDIDLRMIRHDKNRGLSAARNTGFDAADADICIPLDADDVLPADAVSVIRAAFAAHPQADFVFGDYVRREVASGTENVVDCKRLCGPDDRLDPSKLCRKWILLGTSPCKKSAWESIGGYNLKYTYVSQDLDFWMRLLQRGAIGIYIPHPIYVWNCAETSMSKQDAAWHAGYDVRQDNLAFFDRHGAGIEVREELLRYHLRFGNYSLAQVLAAELLRMGRRRRTLQVLTGLPTWSVAGAVGLYSFLRQLRLFN